MKHSSNSNMNRYRVKFINPELKFMIRRFTTFPIMQATSYITYLTSFLLPKAVTCLDRPIFIIGCSRSGTTIFLDMLKEHGELSEWSEAGGVFEPNYFDPEVNHFKDEASVTKFHTRRIQMLFGLFVSVNKGSRFLNKHPQNSLRIGFLRKIFPNAKFIHLVRSGYATTYSNCRQVELDKYRQSIPFGGFPKPLEWKKLLHLPRLLQFGHQWVDVIPHIRSTIANYGIEDDYIEIKYEDFCQDPHNILRKVDIFCDLDPNKRKYDQIPKEFHMQNDSWKEKISQDDFSLLFDICNSLNSDLGYLEFKKDKEVV